MCHIWHFCIIYLVTFTFTILNVRLSRVYFNICPFYTEKTVVQIFFHSLGGQAPPAAPMTYKTFLWTQIQKEHVPTFLSVVILLQLSHVIYITQSCKVQTYFLLYSLHVPGAPPRPTKKIKETRSTLWIIIAITSSIINPTLQWTTIHQ